jgi:hypothetical protein
MPVDVRSELNFFHPLSNAMAKMTEHTVQEETLAASNRFRDSLKI